ncbi:hypothetical protein LCGC14_1728120 [marine sediment metagenome]|uniref:Uncharacterized protein n=1 Tax=marine sediment metagenome TaxID=412755 RepID=A0A0F9HAF0_9ZZZZ
MSVWNVSDEATVKLSSWGVFSVPRTGTTVRRDHHFFGYNAAIQEGRVSSKIVKFYPPSMRGVTASGRKYELLGKPGHNSDASYVLDKWLQINGVKPEEARDVTEEYL